MVSSYFSIFIELKITVSEEYNLHSFWKLNSWHMRIWMCTPPHARAMQIHTHTWCLPNTSTSLNSKRPGCTCADEKKPVDAILTHPCPVYCKKLKINLRYNTPCLGLNPQPLRPQKDKAPDNWHSNRLSYHGSVRGNISCWN